ncbi:MAG: hypothetical protein AAGD01_11305 [Acidobacteriota bacterium]
MQKLVDGLDQAIPDDVTKAVLAAREQSVAPRELDLLLMRRRSRQPFLAGSALQTLSQPSPFSPRLDASDIDSEIPIRDLIPEAPSDAPIKYSLEHWSLQAHAYRSEQAGNIGILGRLFSGSAQQVSGGVIHEAKRFSILETEKKRRVEFGVAVRLAVASKSVSAETQLTLPNLAAEAQLNSSETRVGITVVGYAGPLGNLLPAPSNLDVETYVSYIGAFQNIQALIFGTDGWAQASPTLLSFEDEEEKKE